MVASEIVGRLWFTMNCAIISAIIKSFMVMHRRNKCRVFKSFDTSRSLLYTSFVFNAILSKTRMQFVAKPVMCLAVAATDVSVESRVDITVLQDSLDGLLRW